MNVHANLFRVSECFTHCNHITTPHLFWSASTSRWGGPTRSNRMGAKRPENSDRVHCTPRRELNSQQGDHAPTVQKRSGRPTPVFSTNDSGPQCHDSRDNRKSPQPQQQSHQSPHQQQQQQHGQDLYNKNNGLAKYARV